MSHHAYLTIGELAFLAPGGVILGAVVSYFAVRRSSKDSLKSQELARKQDRLDIEQRLEQERKDKHAERSWEHRSTLYTYLIGFLQDFNGYITDNVPGVFDMEKLRKFQVQLDRKRSIWMALASDAVLQDIGNFYISYGLFVRLMGQKLAWVNDNTNKIDYTSAPGPQEQMGMLADEHTRLSGIVNTDMASTVEDLGTMAAQLIMKIRGELKPQV